ncbi:MAG: Fe2+-dependent dioxygenase [Gammaproteobacteria bacterium]|nr:Fe2+-dependent dioxygenase [Gammaproteobacteria bacterium]
MLLKLSGILNAEDIIAVQQLLADATFIDGKLSAGKVAREHKFNEELPKDAPVQDKLNQIVMPRLVTHPLYNVAALPHRVAAPFYVRYREGMRYGQHIDDPIMGDGPRYRSDIAITVFLNDASDYEGGELSIQTTSGTQEIKYDAGDAVIYPASTLHSVKEVISGERLVAVTWVQSLIRDASQRELLFELHLAREKLLADSPNAEETTHVDHVYTNLVRMWSEL